MKKQYVRFKKKVNCDALGHTFSPFDITFSPFDFVEGRQHLGKTQINLVFRSICTTFDFVEGTFSRKSSNKIWLFTRLFVPLQAESTAPACRWRF